MSIVPYDEDGASPSAPPQNNQAEMAALGCMILSPKALRFGLRELTAPMFYSPAHQQVFDALKHIESKGMDVDLIILRDVMMFLGTHASAGGTDYLLQVSSAPDSAQNIPTYAKIVKDHWKQREYMARSAYLARRAQSGEAEPQELMALAASLTKGLEPSLEDAVLELHQLPFERAVRGIRTLWKKLNEMMTACGGWPVGQLIAILAGTKVGKTNVMSQIALDLFENGESVVYVLFADLDHGGFGSRMIQHKTGFSRPPDDLVMLSEYREVVTEWAGAPEDKFGGRFYVVDARRLEGGTKASFIRRWLPEFCSEKMVTGAFLDYFQAMEPDSRGFGLHTAYVEMANDIEHMAGKMPNTCTFVASQVTESEGAVKARFTPELEHKAGLVLHVKRNKQQEEDDPDRRFTDATIRVALNRFGYEGVIPATFDRRNLTFHERP